MLTVRDTAAGANPTNSRPSFSQMQPTHLLIQDQEPDSGFNGNVCSQHVRDPNPRLLADELPGDEASDKRPATRHVVFPSV